MHKLRWEFEMHHFGWQMLSASIMKCNTSINAASSQQLTIRRIGKGLQWFIELGELFSNTHLIDVKDTQTTCVETTCKDGKAWMSCNTEWIIITTSKLVDLTVLDQIPNSDGFILSD